VILDVVPSGHSSDYAGLTNCRVNILFLLFDIACNWTYWWTYFKFLVQINVGFCAL